MSDIPITDKVRIRPVYQRYLEDKHQTIEGPPSEEEKADAIKVMKELYPPVWEIDEILLTAAEKIFMEASA